MRPYLMLAALGLLSACHAVSSKPQPSPSATPEPMPSGSVGPLQDIWGIWESRFEVSNVSICTDSTCTRIAAVPCWLDGTKEFFDAINQSGIRSFEPGAPPYRIHLQGKVERGARYGHMGSTGCQVDGEQLIAIERWHSL